MNFCFLHLHMIICRPTSIAFEVCSFFLHSFHMQIHFHLLYSWRVYINYHRGKCHLDWLLIIWLSSALWAIVSLEFSPCDRFPCNQLPLHVLYSLISKCGAVHYLFRCSLPPLIRLYAPYKASSFMTYTLTCYHMIACVNYSWKTPLFKYLTWFRDAFISSQCFRNNI